MRVIIAGSRGFKDEAYLAERMWRLCGGPDGWEITEVVCGEAAGADTLGKRWALARGIPVKSFPPDLVKYGSPQAFLVRNQLMANYADALVAFWDGTSSGTFDMIKRARKRGLTVEYAAFSYSTVPDTKSSD
jgi:hypothetical protein